MKTLSLTVWVTLAVTGAYGQEIHRVPVDSKENRIVLTVANGSERIATGEIDVTLTQQPVAITTDNARQKVESVAVGSETECVFTFNVGRDAKPGRKDTLEFRVVSNTGSAATKKVVLQYVGPQEYRLSQNFPNPFNPSTMIQYDLIDESRVTFAIYDILGREVRRIVDEVQPAGCYDQRFDARDLATGAYFYRIQTTPTGSGKSFVAVRKLMVVK